MIQLTEAQVQAMAEQQNPLQIVHPHTQEVYVLIRHDVYDLTCSIVGGKKGQVWDDEDFDLIRKDQ